MSRKNGGNKSTRIEKEIDLDEADKRECIGTATYQEIKDYIMKKYGVKVHTSYIAQVKKKCGLDMKDNYNKSQNDNYVAKQCTKEKEEMIKEALKYFGMIE